MVQFTILLLNTITKFLRATSNVRLKPLTFIGPGCLVYHEVPCNLPVGPERRTPHNLQTVHGDVGEGQIDNWARKTLLRSDENGGRPRPFASGIEAQNRYDVLRVHIEVKKFKGVCLGADHLHLFV